MISLKNVMFNKAIKGCLTMGITKCICVNEHFQITFKIYCAYLYFQNSLNLNLFIFHAYLYFYFVFLCFCLCNLFFNFWFYLYGEVYLYIIVFLVLFRFGNSYIFYVTSIFNVYLMLFSIF